MAELSCAGMVWLVLSSLAALAASSGFFLPYWLQGTYPHPPSLHPSPTPPNPHPTLRPPTPVFLGIFRRCNYPRLVIEDSENDDGDESVGDFGPPPPLSPPARVEVVIECGRYTTFADIPSVWWQIGTVICGTGSAVALLVSMAGMWAVCVRDVMTPGTAKLAAALQLTAGLLIGGGVAVYPLGWGCREVRQVCGPSASAFHLGSCDLYWAFYLTASAAALTLLSALLALCAPSSKADYT